VTAANPLRRALVLAAIVIAIDRASKIWIVEGLGLRHVGRIEVWDPVLNLTMAWNRGINFGLFDRGEDGRFVLVALALAIVAALLWWVRDLPGRAGPVGVGLLVGGALGNVWDRLQWGAVADFLNMSCCGIHNPFAFNIADAAIFAGAIVLVAFGSERRPASEPRDGRNDLR
jgi:signal peptidase II